MDFKWFLDVIKNNYVNFSGRVSKRDFWMFCLHAFLINLVLGLLDRFLGTTGALAGIFQLAILLPSLGLGARRLQDTGKSPLWLLLILTCIGIIPLIIFWIGESQEGANEYGEKPANTI